MSETKHISKLDLTGEASLMRQGLVSTSNALGFIKNKRFDMKQLQKKWRLESPEFNILTYPSRKFHPRKLPL